MLDAAAEPLVALYLVVLPWSGWDADTTGHAAMREWVRRLHPDVVPTPAHTAGWATQYPLLSALEDAAADGEPSRHRLREAARSLPKLDYEGMAPPDRVASPGAVGHRTPRRVVLAQPDPAAESGLRVAREFFAGPTAEAHDFTEPCG